MFSIVFLLLFVNVVKYSLSLEIVNPGPKFPPTKGEIWPKPQFQRKSKAFYIVHPKELKIEATEQSCDILKSAIERYNKIITQTHGLTHESNARPHAGQSSRKGRSLGQLQLLNLVLKKPCENYPYLGMDESYNLTISSTQSFIASNSIWGILRGLESFAQLLYFSSNYTELRIMKTEISDYPAYAHRGLLLDTSRHFISMTNILLILDAMEMNKMNVFHWHIVDDQSFPYQSKRFPELSSHGAFDPRAVYSSSNVQTVIRHARDRGIRVLPEFDVPGHTRSWGVSHPELLTNCYHAQELQGLGPLNPIQYITYDFLKSLFAEIKEVFPEQYFHVGGDEVDMDCWASNPDIQEYMLKNNISSVEKLHAIFMEKALPLLAQDTKPVVWQEVVDEGVELPKDTVVQYWKDYDFDMSLLNDYRILYSTCWYLDHLKTGGDWINFYECSPRGLVTPEFAEQIIGGEACMWGEVVDDANVMSRIWPRASAMAERLWTDPIAYETATQKPKVENRIEEHACRMRRRGISAQPPNGPGFCLF